MSKMRIEDREIENAHIFEILLDNFPDIIHSVNDAGDLVFTNRKAEELLGYTKAELLTMNIRQLYADDILAQVKAGFEQLKDKGVKSVESALKDRNGNRIPVEIRSFAIYGDDGKFLRTFSILRDIRPLKELQNNLVHASRLAVVGELASGIMHDIANPLSIIMMALELCNRRLSKVAAETCATECVGGYVKDMERAAERIKKLLEHMRRYSRNREEPKETVDLHTIIEDALFIAGSKIANARLTVDFRVGKHQCWTQGSPNRLEQVFVNLIANAADAMETQAVRNLTITAGPFQRGKDAMWQCSVRDTGTGIPAEIQNDVFQSFFTTKEKGKGTGLGLSIVRSILADHQGDVTVESEFGHGATFHVYLPQVPVAAEELPKQT